MQNHEAMNERRPRNLYLELQIIEERGRRLKLARRNKLVFAMMTRISIIASDIGLGRKKFGNDTARLV
jgi:hypothetical protein